ncbi:MAG: flagellar protein FlgN [Porphyrobacter sp.]|jgi:flagellar biosynthesis/type III secretory pathway chaperone|nr:flagellar protein FlgN [Porphyrobacter sp.]
MSALAAADSGILAGHLRQLIAVLERERQALALLDADDLFEIARQKEALCDMLAGFGGDAPDEATRALAQTARQLNDVNRRVRNLLAANVAARITALGGTPRTAGLALSARV